MTCEGALSIIAFLCSYMKKRIANISSSLPSRSSLAFSGKDDSLSRVFALTAKLSKFLQYHNQQYLKHFEGSSFLLTWFIWPEFLVPLITWKLLQYLERYFEYYFPDRQQYPTWIRKPFTLALSADINNQHTDDNTELQESEIHKHTFRTTHLHTFWCHTKWRRIIPYR